MPSPSVSVAGETLIGIAVEAEVPASFSTVTRVLNAPPNANI